MKILVLQHSETEHPGIFLDIWRAAGHDWTTIQLQQDAPIPDPEPYDLMVVMGGAMDVWQEDQHPWMKAEKQAIRHWVAELRRPYLGVCLGHQMLADALGGQVRLREAAEIGITKVDLTEAGQHAALLAGLPAHLEIFEWHGAEVSRLPEGGEILAANAACAIQVLRVGESAYGLQFHPELTASTMPTWQAVPSYLAALHTAIGEDEAAKLGPAIEARLASLNATAHVLMDNMLRIAATARNR
jgi:GMP synthase-like glutamine amidotransferase